MESEHVDEQSRSTSRSFICPDCGLGVESIAMLTVHLLTHAELSSDNQSAGHRGCQRHSDTVTQLTPRDTPRDNDAPATASSHGDDDDDDDDDVMDVDDCQTSINHDQSDRHHNQPIHESLTGDLDTSAQGHCDGERDEEPTCLKVTCRQSSTTEDALDDVVLLECPYCQRKDFDSVGPLTSHIRTAHARPSDNLFTCGSCGLAFATIGKLEHHQRAEHDMSTSITPAISAASSLSGQGSPTVDGLNVTEPRWLCRFCPVQFYDAQTQRDHEEAIHLSRASSVSSIMTQLSSASCVVFCSQCSLGFPHIYALADHMHHSHGYNTRARAGVQDLPPTTSPAGPGRTTEPVRPTAVRADSVDVTRRTVSATSTTMTAVCPECPLTFDNDDQLESHVASAHYLNVATEYGCTSCFKLFARPEDLQKHLMDVHAHHLYRCTLCKQVFDSKVCAIYFYTCKTTFILASSSRTPSFAK